MERTFSYPWRWIQIQLPGHLPWVDGRIMIYSEVLLRLRKSWKGQKGQTPEIISLLKMPTFEERLWNESERTFIKFPLRIRTRVLVILHSQRVHILHIKKGAGNSRLTLPNTSGKGKTMATILLMQSPRIPLERFLQANLVLVVMATLIKMANLCSKKPRNPRSWRRRIQDQMLIYQWLILWFPRLPRNLLLCLQIRK